MTLKPLISAATVAAILTGCMSSSPVVQTTRGMKYESLYQENPRSIVIMPPVNLTNHAEAKDYFYTTLYQPLCEKGYYVFPPALTLEIFQQEGAYDSEEFIEGDLGKFAEVMGCDAAMFTRISKWDKAALNGTITAQVEYILRSTITGKTLFQRSGTMILDLNDDDGDPDSTLADAIAGMIVSAIATAGTDKIEAGRKCTRIALDDLPYGYYSPQYLKDKQDIAADSVFTKIKPS